MTLSREVVSKGFIASGISNIAGVLILSRFFTNEVIPKSDPVIMSNFGLLMIVLWGFVFISVAKHYQFLKWLVGLFVIEKLIYGIGWIHWLMNNDLTAVYNQDTMAGIFYTIYGANDWMFFIFFSYVFIFLSRQNKA